MNEETYNQIMDEYRKRVDDAARLAAEKLRAAQDKEKTDET